MARERASIIKSTIEDLVTDFLYYDRKEDEQLRCGEIEAAIVADEITVDEIIEVFSMNLRKALDNG